MENTQNYVETNMSSEIFKTTDDLVSVWLSRTPKANKTVRILKILPYAAMLIALLSLVLMYFKVQSFNALEAEERVAALSGHISAVKVWLFLLSLMFCVMLYGRDVRNDYVLLKLSDWIKQTNFDAKSYLKYLAEQNINVAQGFKYDKSVEAIYISNKPTFRRVQVIKFIWFIVAIIITEIFTNTVLFDKYIKAVLNSSNADKELYNLWIISGIIGAVLIVLPSIIVEITISVKASKYIEELQVQDNQ